MSATSRRLIPKNLAKPAEDSDYGGVQQVTETSFISSALPKHIPFPYIEEQSEFLMETFSFVVALFALGCQYLEMYRTVWWLPEFANKQALHFQLIDKVLISFIVVILARKLLALFVLASVRYLKKRHKSYHTLASYIPLIYALQLCCLLGVCCFDIFFKYGVLDLLCLVYPLILYVIIFGVQVEPFFRTTYESQTNAKYFNGTPLHCCSTKACSIRSEVDGLRSDFNTRFKQTVFSAIVYGYYAGFMPYWFVDEHVVYDPVVVLLNALFICLSGLTLCAVQCFPPKYCDILHRAALHLGQWERQLPQQQPTNGAAIPTWTLALKCLPGTLVRHEGDIYRATGPITTAIPGNHTHFRFFAIFKNPTTIYGTLAAVQLLLMGTQFLALYHTTAWYTVISLSYLIFTNFVTMYCLLRNLRVVHSTYSLEAAIFEDSGVDG